MYLAAFYIHGDDLFDKPRLLNFGGRNTYFIDGTGLVNREPNEIFIDHFYGEHPIELISAIVGKNGAGKTTVFSFLAKALTLDAPSYKESEFVAIFEENNQIYIRGNASYISKFIDPSPDYIRTDTIYYSPFLDFKRKISGIDISLDQWILKDLDSINGLNIESSGYPTYQHLKTRRTKRQIEFIASDFSKILTEFNFPDLGMIKISFLGYLLKRKDDGSLEFWNTPRLFRETLNELVLRIISERRRIQEAQNSYKTQQKYQKDLLKNYLLLDVISLMIRKMEEKNTLLEEGYLLKAIEINQSTPAHDSFYEFLESHYYKLKKSNEKFKLLPVEITRNFLKRLYFVIDNIPNDEEHFIWDGQERAIKVDQKTAIELLDLQGKFLIEIDEYDRTHFELNKEIISPEIERLQGILTFQPSERQLSSGEEALLNLYSRLYNYLVVNQLDVKTRAKPDIYIVLLDEADLGFHPRWKQKFVSSVKSFVTDFFKRLKTPVQIIFTSHDAVTLSDIANHNIVYLDDFKVLSGEGRPDKSFAANITELLADSFFLSDGLVGDFAQLKIRELIKWLQNKEVKQDAQIMKKLIKTIDEPIVQQKLAEMFDEKMHTELQIDLITQQIEELNRKKNKLQG